MEQRLAVIVTAAFAIPLMLVFLGIARSASTPGDPDSIAARGANWRRMTFWGMVIIFVPAIAFSLMRLPYARGDATPDAIVEAKGNQWAWNLAPTSVNLGELVEIRVTSADVNHGFSVYDAKNRLVVQTQAMPGYTNVIRHRFTEAGAYRIFCLEYCGLGHHTMAAQLVVNAGAGSAGGNQP
jgi:cytochrome c oxidase subunit II